MRIAVGSTNPVKIAAVRQIVAQVWPDCQLFPCAVPTGVSAMPLSDAECIAGARNRAVAARRQAQADLGVGIEGGVQAEPTGLMLTAWAVVLDAQGAEGVGSAGRLLLPDFVAARIRQGAELGPVMDELLGQTNVKHKDGAVGAFTNGLVNRREALAAAVAYALAPFLTPHFYRRGFSG
ncbi:MAG: inosine/xanthosine triphosphatase [Ardenticatenales bacterium]|nr:inosine/xanthosine triphosphatase [Ardenticatenales bacterium]